MLEILTLIILLSHILAMWVQNEKLWNLIKKLHETNVQLGKNYDLIHKIVLDHIAEDN